LYKRRLYGSSNLVFLQKNIENKNVYLDHGNIESTWQSCLQFLWYQSPTLLTLKKTQETFFPFPPHTFSFLTSPYLYLPHLLQNLAFKNTTVTLTADYCQLYSTFPLAILTLVPKTDNKLNPNQNVRNSQCRSH